MIVLKQVGRLPWKLMCPHIVGGERDSGQYFAWLELVAFHPVGVFIPRHHQDGISPK